MTLDGQQFLTCRRAGRTCKPSALLVFRIITFGCTASIMYSVEKREGVIPIMIEAAARPSSKISEFFGDTLTNESTSPELRKILSKRRRRPHHANAGPFTPPRSAIGAGKLGYRERPYQHQRRDLRPRSPSDIIESCGLSWFTWPTNLGLISLVLFLLPPAYHFCGLTTLTTTLFITDVVLFILLSLLMLYYSFIHSKCCHKPRQLCHELTSNTTKLGSLAYWPVAWLTLVAFAVFLASYGDDQAQAEKGHGNGNGNEAANVNADADRGGEAALRRHVLAMIAYVMWWIGVVWMTGTMVFVMGVLTGVVGGRSERWMLRKGVGAGHGEEEEDDEVRMSLPRCLLTSAFGMGLLALVGGLLVSVFVRLGTISVGMAATVLMFSFCVGGVAVFTTLLLYAVLQQEMIQVESRASVRLIKLSLWMMGLASVCAAAVQILGRAAEDVSAILGDDDTQRASSRNLFTPATAQATHVVCILLALLLLGLAALWLIFSLMAFMSFAIRRRLSWKRQCNDTVIPVAALALSTVQFRSELNSSFFGVVTCVLVVAATASLLINLALCIKQVVGAATAHDQTGLHSFMEGADTEELQKIATTLSRHRSVTHPVAHHHLDPVLDPESDRFDLSKWVKDFITHLQPEDHAKYAHPSVSFSNLSVFGTGSELQLQASVSNVFMSLFRPGEIFSFGKTKPKQILHDFNGLLKSGELLVVLGRPGSGCNTFLKSICGELHGLHLDDKASIHYNGIPQHQMVKEFKGEVVYNQEVDKHFPHLTVGQTLEFAATVRTPTTRIENMSRAEYCRYMAKVVMAIFGLSHTYHTKVGDDFIRGVSGGERKRVSIAEMFLAGSPICAWDNSTRGLDSSSALKFVQALRMSSNMGNHAHAVAIYQASQAIYDEFDKATVLYEGRQIYFGPASMAKSFFERQGWYCPPRQTTGDFLTAVTNPHERQPRQGMELKVPRTAEEFERYWRESPEYKALQEEIEHHEQEFRGERKIEAIAQLREQKEHRQGKHVRPKSPYTISIAMQIKACTVRYYQRIWGDRTATFTMMFANLVLALIIGSIFYGNPDATAGFAGKGSVLFMAILLNALTAITEINSIYAQRPMVEKHASFAFYHPACEAAAGIVADIPIKFATATIFNILVYFLAGLRREPAQFFLYFSVSYLSTFIMSAFFRTIAASTKTVSQALALAGVLVLALIIYTGYIVPVPKMKPWFGWIRWINPIYYGFEILIANEFHGREFTCSSIVPPYPNRIGDSWICVSTGAVAGRATVSGDMYMKVTYGYTYAHVWRNFGILWAFLVGFMFIYLLATELNSSNTSTAEALVFRRGHVPARLQQKAKDAEKSRDASLKGQLEQETPLDPKSLVDPQTDIFTWKDVVYDIDYQGGQRRLLDHVNGWVKPGTLTALMGASGAGKTTLLNVLAQRTTMGVVTGDMLVNGTPFGADFQRQTGYVQQQDLHLETATVRESLRFSAMLRRPKTVSKQEKYDYVEKVIKMLGIEDYADVVVGVPGEGLNVEQRKLLTIGVELVAKPKLLLFLDEPTSGLDSQSAWTICVFLRKLANAGQAILCTIHQPNAILFQQFDRLLFLAPGGKTVYFGQIGPNSKTLLDYFESNGARPCGDQENPAEYMLKIVADGTNNKGEDWPSVWKASSEYQHVLTELDNIHSFTAGKPSAQTADPGYVASEFAMPFTSQLWVVTERIFQQYWRMPAYIIAKLLLGVMSGLFVGFTFFKPDGTQAGMRNVVFSVFMITTLFTTLVQQIQPLFVTERSLYEVRERPSKTYSWKAFLFANMFVEMPYQVLCGVLTYACFYYPVVGVQDSDRQGLVLLYMIQLFVYSSAFAHMTIAVLPDAQAASGIVILLTMMSTIFSGVLQTRIALPGFWTFMYRVSPFTYWIGGIVSTMLHNRSVTCSAEETLTFNPPEGMSCAQYLGPMMQQAQGVLQNPNASESCRYCAFSVADQYLVGVDIFWNERWRNWGLVWAYIVFDIVVAVVLYYVFRVRGVGRK